MTSTVGPSLRMSTLGWRWHVWSASVEPTTIHHLGSCLIDNRSSTDRTMTVTADWPEWGRSSRVRTRFSRKSRECCFSPVVCFIVCSEETCEGDKHAFKKRAYRVLARWALAETPITQFFLAQTFRSLRFGFGKSSWCFHVVLIIQTCFMTFLAVTQVPLFLCMVQRIRLAKNSRTLDTRRTEANLWSSLQNCKIAEDIWFLIAATNCGSPCACVT